MDIPCLCALCRFGISGNDTAGETHAPTRDGDSTKRLGCALIFRQARDGIAGISQMRDDVSQLRVITGFDRHFDQGIFGRQVAEDPLMGDVDDIAAGLPD